MDTGRGSSVVEQRPVKPPVVGSIPTPVVLSPSEVGAVSEAKVMAGLLAAGYTVLLPFNRSGRYDMVIEHADGTFSRVQAKTGRLETGGIVFPVASSYAHRGRGTKPYTLAECDFFGVYCPETKGVYLVPLLITGARECKLRVELPRNGQKKGIHYANHYRVA